MNAGPVATRGAGAPAGGARAVHKRMMMAWMLALFFGVASYGMARTASQLVPHPHALEELSYYPSGAHLGVATLGHSESAADIAWLRAVQYYGGHRFTDNRFVRMEHVFTETSTGARDENCLIVPGSTILVPLARLLLPRLMPADKGEAWLKHSIEEMGTLEHFLPELYAHEAEEGHITR